MLRPALCVLLASLVPLASRADPTNLGTTPPDQVFELYRDAAGDWNGLLSGELVFDTDEVEYTFESMEVVNQWGSWYGTAVSVSEDDFFDHLWTWSSKGVDTTFWSRAGHGIPEETRAVWVLPQDLAEFYMGAAPSAAGVPDYIIATLTLLTDEAEPQAVELTFKWAPSYEGNEAQYVWPLSDPDESVDPDVNVAWYILAHETTPPAGGPTHHHRYSWSLDIKGGEISPLSSAGRYALDAELTDVDNGGFLKPGCDPDNEEDVADPYCYLAMSAPVTPIASGTVVKVKTDEEDNPVGVRDGHAGNTIIQYLGDDVCVSYFHFEKDSITVKVGDPIEPGDVIGLVGNSGASWRPHLHFEVWQQYPLSSEFEPLCYSQPGEARTTYFNDIDVTHMGSTFSGYQGALYSHSLVTLTP